MLLSLIWIFTQLLLQIRGQTWHEFEGHCYTILSVKNNFDTCKYSCQQYGAYILELEAELELQFVRTLIDGSTDQYWVGLDFNNSTQKFYWDRDGQEPLSSMWMTSEPNLSGRCVRLATEAQAGTSSGANTFLLGDHYCTSSYRVICEKNVDMMEAVNYREIITSAANRCPMVTYPTRSKLHCARNCSKNKFCIGFQYNDRTQACTPYRFTTSCATPQISPLSMYIMEYARC
uniref:C-type lectin domain-containing protein n=1 Tax=Arion vulgaris TaxID=1028688 RepID=A0A0B6YT51_9EUPU